MEKPKNLVEFIDSVKNNKLVIGVFCTGLVLGWMNWFGMAIIVVGTIYYFNKKPNNIGY